jgi:hypothetical protein
MSKKDILLKSIENFYDSNPKNLRQLEDILNHQVVSLRCIEEFVTSYSREKHTTIDTPNGSSINVHIAYKSSLSGYSKKLFDPFCRTERIEFKGFTTTIAQLNFIRWCITNGIVDHIKSLKEYRSRLKTQDQCDHSNTASIENF